jgi:hypothetical protein
MVKCCFHVEKLLRSLCIHSLPREKVREVVSDAACPFVAERLLQIIVCSQKSHMIAFPFIPICSRFQIQSTVSFWHHCSGLVSELFLQAFVCTS